MYRNNMLSDFLNLYEKPSGIWRTFLNQVPSAKNVYRLWYNVNNRTHFTNRNM